MCPTALSIATGLSLLATGSSFTDSSFQREKTVTATRELSPA